MNKLLSFICISFIVFSCGPSQEELEKERQHQEMLEQQRQDSIRLIHFNHFISIADSLRLTKNYHDAIISLDSATIYANEEVGSIQANKGLILSELKLCDSAVNSFSIAINNKYDLINTYYQRALCYEKMHLRQLAVDDLKEAIKLGNKDANELHEKINPELKRISEYVTRCCDGSTSNATGRGACSRHGGVCNWNEPVYETYRKY